jgi:hypothetical protein
VSLAPVNGGTITAPFGKYPKSGKPHHGIDFAVPEGTPIVAVWAGTVVQSGWDTGGFGWHVRTFTKGVLTIYGHMNGPSPLKVGDKVAQGTLVGHVGHSGNATGSHVHLEVRVAGTPVDPAPYLSGAKGLPTGTALPDAKANPIEQAGDVIGSAAGGVLGGLDAVGAFFGAMGERSTWIRVLQVVGGAALVTAGVVIVGKGVIADVAVSALPGGGVLKAAAGK